MFLKAICTAHCASLTHAPRAIPPYVLWQTAINVRSMLSSVLYSWLFLRIVSSICILTPPLDNRLHMHHLCQGGVRIEYNFTSFTELVTGIWLSGALAQCVCCLGWYTVAYRSHVTGSGGFCSTWRF